MKRKILVVGGGIRYVVAYRLCKRAMGDRWEKNDNLGGLWGDLKSTESI